MMGPVSLLYIKRIISQYLVILMDINLTVSYLVKMNSLASSVQSVVTEAFNKELLKQITSHHNSSSL